MGLAIPSNSPTPIPNYNNNNNNNIGLNNNYNNNINTGNPTTQSRKYPSIPSRYPSMPTTLTTPTTPTLSKVSITTPTASTGSQPTLKPSNNPTTPTARSGAVVGTTKTPVNNNNNLLSSKNGNTNTGKNVTEAPVSSPTKNPTKNPTKVVTPAPVESPTKNPTNVVTDPPIKAPSEEPLPSTSEVSEISGTTTEVPETSEVSEISEGNEGGEESEGSEGSENSEINENGQESSEGEYENESESENEAEASNEGGESEMEGEGENESGNESENGSENGSESDNENGTEIGAENGDESGNESESEGSNEYGNESESESEGESEGEGEGEGEEDKITTDNPTMKPTNYPSHKEYVMEYRENNGGEDQCSILTNTESQCTMDNFETLSTKILPLPYDRPVHASLYCAMDSCKNSPFLPNHKIISSQSYDGEEFLLDVTHPIDTKCHDTNADIYDNEDQGIKVSHLDAEDNEYWVYCLRVVNDNGQNDESFEYPILHIDFELSNLDLEYGFDNLFLTFQQDYRYDDYVYVWSGKDKKIHSYKHDPILQSNHTDGVYLDSKIFWNTKSHHLSFTEVCLHFQSDDSVPSKGFEGIFKVRHEMGLWTHWTPCHIKSAGGVGDDRCGVGITKRTQFCPRYDSSNNLINVDTFWSLKQSIDTLPVNSTLPPELTAQPHLIDNSTHICFDQYTLNPPEFCIVDWCHNITYDSLAGSHAFGKRFKGINEDGTFVDGGQLSTLKYHFNGRTRYDAARREFANPFELYPNINTTVIDIDYIKSEIKSHQQRMLLRYQGKNMEKHLEEAFNMQRGYQRKKLGMRLLSSLLLGKKFTYVPTGSSNTAGHDNVWLSAYPMQLQSYMQGLWNKIGLRGASFRVRDAAIGGHVGTQKLGTCISALIDNHDRKIDFITWESMMNDNSGIKPFWEEIWLRNVMGLSESINKKKETAEYVTKTYGDGNDKHKGLISTQYRKYQMPFMGAVSTAAGSISAMAQNGRTFFNSFMKYYYDQTGVVNLWGGFPCNHGVPGNISNHDMKYSACWKSNARWHPSAHRHRVIAEVYAYAFMSAALERLEALEEDIKKTIEPTGNRPNYKLACLLENGKEYWTKKVESMTDRTLSSGEGLIDEFDNQFKRPLTDAHTVPTRFLNSSWWCINSFFPTPDHSKIHHFVTDSSGFSNVDILDTPVSPMIFRNGGRMSIDHKAQWRADNKNFGAFIEVWVKVLTRFIMIPGVLGQSRVNAASFFSRFDITVNGIPMQCANRNEENYEKPESLSGFWDNGGGNSCVIDVEKPGKYLVKLIYREQNPDNAKMPVLFDMIVGF